MPLPRAFRFEGKEVLIEKHGVDVVLIAAQARSLGATLVTANAGGLYVSKGSRSKRGNEAPPLKQSHFAV